MPDIAVIIVNYNAAEMAIDAVESVLERDHGGRGVEIHLVDNASPDGSASRLAEAAAAWGRRVIFYPEAENHGFGRGNNVALTALASRAEPPELVFLLNPDAVLANEAIDLLATFLETHPKAVLAGPRILAPEGHAVTAAFRFPSLLGTFGSAVNFGPISRLFARWEVAMAPELPECPVDWVSGAAFMARFEAICAAGFFHPGFFLYFEETDLMRAVRAHGGEVWHVPDARVTHIEGGTTGVETGTRRRQSRFWYQSWRIYFTKNHGRGAALTGAVLWVIGAALDHGISRLRGREPGAPRHFFRDFWGIGIRPLIGLSERSDG
ncbi:MAG: glycosyltransferase family 2 protein [Pseudomonadota bacterium]